MAAKWAVDVLKAGGFPVTPQNVKFLENWQKHEGGWTNNDAKYNPLNTTRGKGRPINSVGVKAFSDYNTGMSNTAATLRNGRYPNLVAGLEAGNPYKFDIKGDLSTWVSGSPTGGLSYAQRVMSGRGGASPAPSVKSGKQRQVSQAQKGPSKRALQSQAFLNFAMEYARTGEVTSNAAAELLGAVDAAGSVEPPAYEQAKAQTKDPVGNSVVDQVLAKAHSQIGKPYVFGSGPDTSSFDCSDLIQWAYGQVGIEIPRVTGDQIKVGKPVPWGKFKPGDLIFSQGGGHVVMYVGGGKVIAAPRTGTVVQYQPVSRFRDSFVGARRIVG